MLVIEIPLRNMRLSYSQCLLHDRFSKLNHPWKHKWQISFVEDFASLVFENWGWLELLNSRSAQGIASQIPHNVVGVSSIDSHICLLEMNIN